MLIKILALFLRIYSFKSVRVVKANPLTLIQTDKYEYRPSQTVHIRMMLMNEQLRPSKAEQISEVFVTDPSGSRLHQWRDVDRRKGLGQVSFELSDEPNLGKWTVTVKIGGNVIKEAKANFVVNENILPTFEVSIDGPKSVIVDSEAEEFKACAKYTHGAGVSGAVTMNFTIAFRRGTYWRAPIIRKTVSKKADLDKEGCAMIALNKTEVKELVAKKSPIQVFTAVKEAGTGEKQNKTQTVTVNKTPFKIEAGSSPKEHIVGDASFPFVGKLRTVDHEGNAKPEVKLHVCASLYSSLQDMKNYVNSHSHKFYSFNEEQFYELGQKMIGIKFRESCQDLVTDANGDLNLAVSFHDITVPENITKLTVRAKALDFPENKATGIEQPKLMHDVFLTHSNATTALSIFSKDKSSFDCELNQVKDLNFYFFTSFFSLSVKMY